MKAIRMEKVNFSYPECEKKALDNINLDIDEAEIVVICGASGSGKTTLLRNMVPRLIPNGNGSGNIFICGREVDEMTQREQVMLTGYVGQNPENQIVTDKVWHELAFGLENLSYDNQKIRQKTAETASYFGIQDLYEKSTQELSGGQKQLVNLAAVMTLSPAILVLDEPTSQLDPVTSIHFLEKLRKLNQDFATTIVMTEHRLEDTFAMADRVIVMDQGKIIENAAPKDLFRNNKIYDSRIITGLPSAMKIYLKYEKENSSRAKTGDAGSMKTLSGDVPVTVREGRNWLKEKVSQDAGKRQETSAGKLLPETEKRQENQGQENQGQKNQEQKNQERDRKNTIFSKKESPVISLKNISFRYNKADDYVLKDLQLDIKKGEILAILGGNGSGKSTLLKLIAGLVKPSYGKIKKEIKKEAKTAYVMQNPMALFTEITVEEEMAEALTVQAGRDNRITEEDIRKKTNEMLEFMELTSLRKSNPYDLSGGEKQKLAIGKVLLLEPSILLLDEPTKGIDPYFKEILAGKILELKNKGMTIVIVSHDIEFCAEYADSCALLFGGEIVSEAPTRQFFEGNDFYTTAAGRISRGILRGCVTCEDITAWLNQPGGQQDAENSK